MCRPWKCSRNLDTPFQDGTPFIHMKLLTACKQQTDSSGFCVFGNTCQNLPSAELADSHFAVVCDAQKDVFFFSGPTSLATKLSKEERGLLGVGLAFGCPDRNTVCGALKLLIQSK